jgi:alpha-ketoglutarate-dependent 2,4-dichlorophenoxyacetate dioxygenase
MSDAAQRQTDYRFDVRPLTPRFGAEILGLDLSSPLDEATFADVYRAFLDYQLLLFRHRELPKAAQVAFAGRFGEVQVHVMNQYRNAEFPELYTLSNLDADGRPSGKHPDRGTMYWHTDNSWSKVTGQATMLYVEVAPAHGGGTEWADMYGAYELLTPAEKARLAAMRAVHDLNFSRTRRHGDDPMTEEQRRQKPPVDHPIVRTHGETGRKCLFLGDHASHILGLPVDEGRAIVEDLNASIVKPEIVYRHSWRPRDFVVWDNRCLLHRAQSYDTGAEPRVIRRCTVLGEVPA